MTPEERNLISGLFDRLRKADANAPAKDREAEELIRQSTAQVPGAVYLLTQTTLVQEHALTNAQARIEALEKQLAQAQQAQQSSGSSGGFLSGLFGGHSSPPPMPQAPPPMPQQPQTTSYPSTVNMAPSAGGGFLRNALGAAAGVAGGAMLFQGIQNLLGHNAGPFGSFGGGGGGGGGFLGGGGPREIVNNYYNEPGHEGSGGGSGGGEYDNTSTGGGELGEAIPQGAADQPANPGYEDARYQGNNFDTSNPFDKPVDDQSFFGARDESSLDNNYDLDNTDAGNGGDFVGGDNDGGNSNDDGSYV